jgi:hypothetical protein
MSGYAQHEFQTSRAHKRQERDLTAGPFDDRQVLSFEAWCRLNNLSPRTGRRVLASGDGPRVTQLSAHRIGITYADNRAWQESRDRDRQRKHRTVQPGVPQIGNAVEVGG